jgi:hypothetical protein
MEFLVIAAVIGLLPAAIAKSKGHSFGLWWLYGAALFIIALPHAIMLKASKEGLEAQAASEGKKKCPFCAEMIQAEAKVCRYCGRELPAQRTPETASIDELRANLQSADPVLRERSLSTLGDRGASAVGALADIEPLSKDPDRTVRARAKWALESIRRHVHK